MSDLDHATAGSLTLVPVAGLQGAHTLRDIFSGNILRRAVLLGHSLSSVSSSLIFILGGTAVVDHVIILRECYFHFVVCSALVIPGVQDALFFVRWLGDLHWIWI